MATSKTIRAAESESDDDFGMLMHRFLMATERLQLAAHALARGEDYGPAGCVVEEVTEALEKIRREFERFERNHEFIEGGAIMSKVTAARTDASPDEQSSRGCDLSDELDKKLTQAKGVCGAMMHITT